MNVAFDIDGTIDSFPQVMLGLVTALTAAGHHVYIITGIEQDKVTPTDVRNKKAFLIGLGFGPGTYKELIVLPQPHDTVQEQPQYHPQYHQWSSHLWF